MPKLFAVSELARRFNCQPREISDLLYRRAIPDSECPIVGGRRLISEELVPVIEHALTVRKRCRQNCESAKTGHLGTVETAT